MHRELSIIFRAPRTGSISSVLLGTVVTVLAMGVIGFGTGFLDWRPRFEGLLETAAIALFLPALGEELIFRGPLLALIGRGRVSLVYFACAVSLALFVGWHVVSGAFILTSAQDVFSDWRFLSLAGVLGFGLTAMTLLSRSIWPAVAFHWLVVVAWKGLFGGPSFL